jgi:hypothetical protein
MTTEISTQTTTEISTQTITEISTEIVPTTVTETSANTQTETAVPEAAPAKRRRSVQLDDKKANLKMAP